MVNCDKEQQNCLNNCLPSEVFTQWIFPNLHPVDICRCRCVCKTWLTWTVTYFRLVKSLDFCDGFSEYYISEDGLLSIIRVLVNLRYIRLDGLWRSATELNLVKLTRRCRRLEVLSIASCRGVTDEVLKAAALNCANLKVLDVSRCQQVSDKGIKYLGRHCKKLKELYVGSCFGVTDDGVQAVLKGCSELETLDISRCYSISDDGLRVAAVHPNNLSLIRLTGCLKTGKLQIHFLANSWKLFLTTKLDATFALL